MYSVKITSASKELTAKERVLIKDTTGANKLDGATAEGCIIIKPAFFAELEVHNDNSEDKVYNQYVIVDYETGEKYVTGSTSFWSSFINIVEEMEDSEEDWSIKVFRSPSKNRAGQHFLSCSIV